MGEGKKYREGIRRPPEGAMEADLLREAVARQSAESSPPPDLPVAKKEGQKVDKFTEEQFLDEDYIEEVREYYQEFFSNAESIKKLLKENGFKPLSLWIQGTKEFLEKHNLAESCLEYTVEALSESEKYKGRKEDIENAIIEKSFEKIPEIGEEIAKAIVFYYSQALEDKLERAKKDVNKNIINAELGKAREFLKKYDMAESKGESLGSEETRRESGSMAESPEEKQLLGKIEEAVQKSLEEAIGKMRNLTDNQLLISGVERYELEKEAAEIQKRESIEEIVKECFDAFRGKYPIHYWTASNLIKDWADSFVQSEFTIHGSEALKNAFHRAYQFERGVSKSRSKKLGMTAEELEQVFPKSAGDVSISRRKVGEESEKIIKRVFDREGRMEDIRKVVEVILKIHKKLLEESKKWRGCEDLTNEERKELVADEYTKPSVVRIYDELLIQGKGFPSGERFKRAFYSYVVSRISEI